MEISARLRFERKWPHEPSYVEGGRPQSGHTTGREKLLILAMAFGKLAAGVGVMASLP